MRFAIYSRKSVLTGRGESIENQMELCRSYLAAHYPGVRPEEVAVYEDEGFSGKDFQRHLAKLPLDVRQDQPEHGEVFLAQLQLFPDQGRRLFRRVSLAQLLIIFGLDVQWKISAVQ